MIKRFEMKQNLTIDDIKLTNRIREGGVWISKDSKWFLHFLLVDTIELDIGFPDDLSIWDDFDHVIVLDSDFCQPYYPFYHCFDSDFPNRKPHSDYLCKVIDRYNEVMSSLDFLVEV